ncbi:hypothetical protein SALBM311S_01568 [Streptomyces alboniger]
MEGGEQDPHGGCGLRRGQVVGAQPHAVLGHQQGHTGEVAREQPGQDRGAAGRGVAQVDGAETFVLVPVEREGAQGTFQLPGDGEQFGYARLARRARGAGRTTGAFEGAHGDVGTERPRQPAFVAGEFGEPVQSAGETVRLCGGRPFGSVRLAPVTQRGRQLAVALGEPPACTPSVHHPVVLRGPQRCRTHPADLRRQRDPALVLLAFAATERVDVELAPLEPAHEPVAPEHGVTAHIRIATLRKQSDAHERTPISRMGSRRWPGGSQREERMRTRRWRDGRLSVAPPKGVNGRNFPVRIAFGRAKRSFAYVSSQAIGRHCRSVVTGDRSSRPARAGSPCAAPRAPDRVRARRPVVAWCTGPAGCRTPRRTGRTRRAAHGASPRPGR